MKTTAKNGLLLVMLVPVFVSGCCGLSTCRRFSDQGNIALDVVESIYSGKAVRRSDDFMVKAARAGDRDLVEILLARAADVNLSNRARTAALRGAALNGHTEVVSLLLDDGTDVNARSPTIGLTALSCAAMNDRIETVTLLLDRHADPKSRDVSGRTALMWAITSYHESSAQTLLRSHAAEAEFDPDSRDDCGDGDTLLIMASRRGLSEIVKQLLNMGADVNLANKYGFTPLMLAASEGFAEAGKILIAHGAHLHVKDYKGRTALDMAKEKNHLAMMNVLGRALAASSTNETGRLTTP